MSPAHKPNENLPLSRREFLENSAKCAALAYVGTAASGSVNAADPATKPIRVAVMGVNSRGRQLTQRFAGLPQVDVKYICDPDLSVVGRAVEAVTEKGGAEPKVIQDFRVALDDSEVDALVCAAPDHWHALATILACQAGKDVYVEKPASHSIIEGRRMVEAARKYDRVVQVGTQRRSGTDFESAVKLVQSGRLGKVLFARAWANKRRPDIGKQQATTPPTKLDFDLWCGPAPNHGYRENLVHYHWHWRWDYGTGECGNLGAHSLDVARWGLGVEYPTRIVSGGGRYAYDDDKETPDTQFATFDFGDVAIQWEHRMWANAQKEGARRVWGVQFYGTEATLDCFSSGWKLYHGDELLDSYDKVDYQTAHIKNFLDCMVTRQKPNADIEIGHRSATLPHLANIAYRTGSTIQFDASTETILGNDQANALIGKSYRKGFELPTV